MMQTQDEQAFLTQVLQNEPHAIALCQTLARVSQTIDDLHDGDNVVTTDTLKTAAWEMLVEIPSNAFYQAHFVSLQPIVRVCLSDWFDSTALEKGGDHEQAIAFVLRDSLIAFVNQCAYLVGGPQWMMQVGPAVRQRFHDETLSDYRESLAPPAKIEKKPTAKKGAS